MMEKHEIVIPNGRITVKQEKKASVPSGPMGMFVAADEDKLLRLAKELGQEAAKSCANHCAVEAHERKKRRNKNE